MHRLPLIICFLAFVLGSRAQEGPSGRDRHQTSSGLWVRYPVEMTFSDKAQPGVQMRPLTGHRTRRSQAQRRKHYVYRVNIQPGARQPLVLPLPFDRKGTMLVDPSDRFAVQRFNRKMEWEEQYRLARKQQMAFATLQLATGATAQSFSAWYVQPRFILHAPTGLIHRYLTGLFSIGVGPRLSGQSLVDSGMQALREGVTVGRWEGYAQLALPLRSWLIGYRYQLSTSLDLDPRETEQFLVLGVGRETRSQPFFVRAMISLERLLADPAVVTNPQFIRFEVGWNLLNPGNGAKLYARRAKRKGTR